MTDGRTNEQMDNSTHGVASLPKKMLFEVIVFHDKLILSNRDGYDQIGTKLFKIIRHSYVQE